MLLVLPTAMAEAASFVGTQTGPTEWTYSLTYDPDDNYAVCPPPGDVATITLSGLAGVVAATPPTSTDYLPPGGLLDRVNLQWIPQVLKGGTAVTWTHVGPGTGNNSEPKHVFGFKVSTATPVVSGTVNVASDGFSIDVSGTGPCPVQPADDRDFTGTTVGPAAPHNQPPTAVARFPRHVSFGDVVSLDGSGSSDPDGGALRYSWTQVAGPRGAVLAGAASAIATFVAPSDVQTLTFQLTVTDPEGATATALAPVTMVVELARAVFVSVAFGNDGQPGTPAAPVRSLERANALALGHSPAFDVYIDQGDYFPTQTLLVRDDMSLYGGFAARLEGGELLWSRERGEFQLGRTAGPRGPAPTIHGRATAVTVLTITRPTTIEDVRIFAADAGGGQNSVGIYVREATSALRISYNEIVAGLGGAGASGAAATDGLDGLPGAGGLGSIFLVPAVGGEPGHGAYDGGRGGSAPPNSPGFPGLAGAGARAGAGGLGGGSSGGPSHDGQAGGIASNSPHGDGGAGGDGKGQIVGHEWRATPGTAGSNGQHGSGGGGGGGGLGGHTTTVVGGDFTPSTGGGGGGGGGGGRAGLAGRGGGGGGGSIGIFLSAASPAIGYNRIETRGGGAGGAGGLGGRGGNGGAGGIGGHGGTPFIDIPRLGHGGNGGRGGVGGSGGGGGGGGGGVSCDVFSAEGSQPAYVRGAGTVLGPVGRGGAGANGWGGAGENGKDGLGCSGEPAAGDPPTPVTVIPRTTTGLGFTIGGSGPRIGRATVASTWSGSDVEMSLVSPAGRLIDRSTTDPSVDHVVGPTFESYSITDPESGAWTVNLFGAVVPPQGETVVVQTAQVAANRPPVADAGTDLVAEAESPRGAPVILDGSASSDLDSDALGYHWSTSEGALGVASPLEVTLPLGTHPIRLTVDDGHGGTGSDDLVVTVQDTRPPTITLATQKLVRMLPTAGARSVPLDLTPFVEASDLASPPVSLTSDAPAAFPLGFTTVTFTARDGAGNAAQASLDVQVVYGFTGFQWPGSAGEAVNLKAGRAVPVRFRLTAADGSMISGAIARLAVFRLRDDGLLEPMPVSPEGRSNDENLFRFNRGEGQYVYNFNSRGLAPGWYRFTAILDDASLHDGDVTFRVNSGHQVANGTVLPATGTATFGADPLPPEEALELRLGPVRPNPVRGEARLRVALPTHAPALLEVMDVTGRAVLVRTVSGAGWQEVRLPERLAPGVYLVRLRQGEAQRTARFAVVR